MLEKSSKQFISLAPRTKRVRHEETWWKAVQSIAALFRKQHDGKELSEPAIKQHLVGQEFDDESIRQAFDWIERASLSGHLVESLAMLEAPSTAVRVHSPIEALYLPQRLRNRLEICRLKGFLSQEVVERLLEGLRILDARDMEEDELVGLLAELLSIAVPTTPRHEFFRILAADLPELYS